MAVPVTIAAVATGLAEERKNNNINNNNTKYNKIPYVCAGAGTGTLSRRAPGHRHSATVLATGDGGRPEELITDNGSKFRNGLPGGPGCRAPPLCRRFGSSSGLCLRSQPGLGDRRTMTTLASRIRTRGGNDGPPTKESGLPLAIFGKDKIALVVYVATYAPGSSYRVKLVVGTARPVAGRKQGNMEDWCFNSKGEVVSGETLATSFAGLVRSFAAKGTGVGCLCLIFLSLRC